MPIHYNNQNHPNSSDSMSIRAYLRASTDEQDAERAKQSLMDFVQSHGKTISTFYIENSSGASLDRPQLTLLLNQCQAGDIILVESIDRLTRLNNDDWERLKGRIRTLGVYIVALDIPTSHQLMNANKAPYDEITARITLAINDMMIDIFSAFARKDYELRRERQAQGIAKAKAQGKYKGRKPNTTKHEQIQAMLRAGIPQAQIVQVLKCSYATIQAVKKRVS